MKKRNIKTLKLNKKQVSSFENISGGRPPLSFRQTECTCSPSQLTHCLAGCTAISYDTPC